MRSSGISASASAAARFTTNCSGVSVLGPLAGAQAELTDIVKKHRVGAGTGVAATVTLGAGAILAMTTKKSAFAYVTFANGDFRETKVKGKSEIQEAQREVVKFNAMARGAS